MGVPQVIIEKSLGQIGINNIPSEFKLDKINPNVEIDYGGERPFQIVDSVEIKNSSVDLKIDQTKILEEYGFYKVRALTKYISQKDKKKISESISEIVQEGEYLSKIEDNNKIAEIAKRELGEEKQFNIALLPESKPEIDVKTKKMKVNIKNNKMKVDTEFYYPKLNYKKGKIEIYMKEKGYFNIDLKGNNINLKI